MKKVLAIDIGGTNTRLAIVNEKLKIEDCIFKPTVKHDKEKFVQNILDGIHELNISNVESIGAGVPGVVDREKGIILDLPNVFVKDIPIRDILYKETGLETYLRNDAEVACLAEACSPLGKKYSRVFFITISTGLGGSLCVGQEIQDYVTEVGHTLTKYKDKYVEFSILAGIKFKEFAALNGEPDLTPQMLFEGVRSKSKKHQQIYCEWLQFLNNFLRLMIDSYHPELMVFTGGFINDKDIFLNDVKKLNKDVKIKETYFGTNAGLIGAAVYAFQSSK